MGTLARSARDETSLIDQRPTRARKFRGVAIVAILLLAGSIATIATFRRPIAERLLAARLRDLGLTPAEFEIARFDSEAFELIELQIGGRENLEIARIEIHYSVIGLWKGRLEALRIEGLHLRGTIDDEGVSLGVLDALFEPSEEGSGEANSAAGSAVLPFSRIELDDVQMVFDTDAGPVEASLSVQILEAREGHVEISVDLSATHPDAKLAIQLNATGSPDSLVGEVKLESSAAGTWATTTTRGISISTKTGFSFEDGEISLQPEGCVALHADSLAVEDVLTLTEPLDLCLRSSAEPAIRISRDGAVDFEVELSDANRNLVLKATGTHDLVQGDGQAELHLQRIEFSPGGVQPADLFPILSDAVTGVSGSVWMDGSLGWNPDQHHGQLEVFVSDFSATSELATIEHLNGAIALSESGTPPNQSISMGRINFGLELTDGLITYQIEPDGVIAIESASWKFAGGELSTAGRIDLGSPNQEISLHVAGIDLAELINLVELKGLSGSGTLDGELPLLRSGNDIEIRNAVIHSRGNGVIQYRPESSVANLGASSGDFSEMLTILENFYYDEIEFKINGIASGAALIQIHLEGRNPNYNDGQARAFNISLDEQHLPGLFHFSNVTSIPYRIPDAIRRKLESSKRSTQ